MNWQDVAVRRLEAGDRPAWEVLWRGYQGFFRSSLPSDVSQTAWRRLNDDDEPLFGLCGFVEDHRMAGIVHCSVGLSTWTVGPQVHLLDLFVDEALRGRGVGRALIEAVYREADRMRAEQVFWHAPQSDFRSKLLYRKLGSAEPAMIRYLRQPWKW